jgi:hypothetical protein
MSSFRYKFTADATDFHRKRSGMEAGMKATAASVKAAFATMLPMVTAVFSVGGIRGFISEMSNLYHLTQQLNVPAKELQFFQWIFESVGYSASDANRALADFQKKVGEAANGTGVLGKVFEQYGISAKNAKGEIKSNTELLTELADVIKRIKDPTERARVAYEAFGRQGKGMIQLLSGGSTEIEKLIGEFENLGYTTDEQAKKMAILDQKFTDFGQSVRTEMKNVVVAITDAFGGDFDALINDVGVRLGNWLWKMNAQFVDGFVTLSKQVINATDALARGIGDGIGNGFKVAFESAKLAVLNFVEFTVDQIAKIPGPIGAAARKFTGIDEAIANTKANITAFKADAVESFTGIGQSIADAVENTKEFTGAQDLLAKTLGITAKEASTATAEIKGLTTAQQFYLKEQARLRAERNGSAQQTPGPSGTPAPGAEGVPTGTEANPIVVKNAKGSQTDKPEGYQDVTQLGGNYSLRGTRSNQGGFMSMSVLPGGSAAGLDMTSLMRLLQRLDTLDARRQLGPRNARNQEVVDAMNTSRAQSDREKIREEINLQLSMQGKGQISSTGSAKMAMASLQRSAGAEAQTMAQNGQMIQLLQRIATRLDHNPRI